MGTLVIKALMLVSSVKRRAWSMAEVLADSDVAAVTSAVRCVSCVRRFANWTSSAFCAVRKLALGTVVVVVVESAEAIVGIPRPMAAASASATNDRLVRFFMFSPFKGTLFKVENAVVRVM